MDNEFIFLAEKEDMWAQMLMEVLKDNDIPCVSMSVYGAGFTNKTGIKDHLKIYVPAEKQQQAQQLLEELFSENAIVDEFE